MRTKRLAGSLAVVLSLFGAPITSVAGDPPPEMIQFEGTTGKPMEAPGVYPRIYSGAIEFTHKKHFSEYGPTCADCHHDDSGEPREDLEPGGDVDLCIDCHDEGGLVYGRRADEMDADELIAHRPNVVHKLCIGCHEKTSAKKRAIVAPIACRVCHAQRERDYALR